MTGTYDPAVSSSGDECRGECVTRPHRWSPSGARCVRTGCRTAGTGDPCGDGDCSGTD